MPPQALAAVATILSCAAHDNRVDLKLDRGSAEMVWLTPSSFHFRRALEGALAATPSPAAQTVELQIDEQPGVIHVRSRILDVAIARRGVLLRIRLYDGSPLTADLSEPRASAGGVTWERQALAGVRFYGLGPRTDAGFDLSGKQVAPASPLLISTAGYGEFHVTEGAHRFDFFATDRYRIRAPAVDYYFYYGPTPKQIFEEHHAAGLASEMLAAPSGAFGSWSALRATLLWLVHGAMSGVIEPAVSVTPFSSATSELLVRARQLLSLVPGVAGGSAGLSRFRGQLASFFETYAAEARERGFPAWRPLPFQFPEDPECSLHADEFMLGDEMLIAPIYEPGGRRSLYLPQGIWTNLETNEEFRGRRSIAVETASLPVFARSGTIVPLDSPGGIGLHYFPKLAAEFFLLENGADDWTQAHAAPAGDIIRLEIEARTARDYQWVVHHIGRPSEVGFDGRKFTPMPSQAVLADNTWFYDAERQNLHVRVHTAKGEDSIVNVTFP